MAWPEDGGWTIRTADRVLVRDNGVLLYDGPSDQMPEDVKKVSEQHVFPWNGHTASGVKVTVPVPQEGE